MCVKINPKFKQGLKKGVTYFETEIILWGKMTCYWHLIYNRFGIIFLNIKIVYIESVKLKKGHWKKTLKNRYQFSYVSNKGIQSVFDITMTNVFSTQFILMTNVYIVSIERSVWNRIWWSCVQWMEGIGYVWIKWHLQWKGEKLLLAGIDPVTCSWGEFRNILYRKHCWFRETQKLICC